MTPAETHSQQDGGERQHRNLQACAIPYRIEAGTIQYLLVTTSSGDHWIFPKGIVDPGFTPAEAALQEAFEEAGVRGELSPRPLASFERHKWGRQWEVHVFSLSCEILAEDWLENWRQRRWANYDEARKLLEKPMARALREVHRTLTGESGE